MRSIRQSLFVATALLFATSLLRAQPANPPAPPTGSAAKPAKTVDDDDARDRLDEKRFTSRAAGVSFRPPLGGAMTKRAGVGTDVVQYSGGQESWSLKVSRAILEKPTKLVGVDDPQTPGINEAITNPGLLDITASQLVAQNPGSVILRKEVSTLQQKDLGTLISRFSVGPQFWLRQQAFLEINDQFYYVFDFTSPSGHQAAEKDDAEDPAEKTAADIFEAMLDSVALIDPRPIIEDNNTRLFRTRTLMLNFPKAIHQTVAPEQAFRVIKDGKDIGFSYVSEEVGERQGETGVIVAVLSQGTGDGGLTVKVGSEMFASLDFKTSTESWVTHNVIERDNKADTVSEIGNARKEIGPIRVKAAGGPAGGAASGPNIRIAEKYEMHVVQTSKQGAKKVDKELPPFYIPQAINNMLPRLVPLREPKTYLFTVWLGSERELIYRYIDVEDQQRVVFNGREVMAVVVKDRIGLEGEPTLHYFRPEGQYLGSFNTATKVSIVVSDLQTLTKLWPNVEIGRPHLLDKFEPTRPQANNVR